MKTRKLVFILTLRTLAYLLPILAIGLAPGSTFTAQSVSKFGLGVFVFIGSSIIHMFLPHHRSDWDGVPDEDGFIDAVRRFDLPAGDYVVPRAVSPEAMKEVGIFAAYISGRGLGPGADYRAVFRLAGCTAFFGYAPAHMQRSIWYKQPWSTTLKNMFDGFVYGLLTGGAFGWLWPDA